MRKQDEPREDTATGFSEKRPTRSEKDQAIIDRVREDLLSGAVFARGAMGAGSVIGYQPPINRRDWAHVVGTLARMAAESDKLAQVAREIIPKLNLYGTRSQIAAKVYEGAFAAVKAEYDDVIGRSGPEPSRYKLRPYDLSTLVHLDYWIHEAIAPIQSCVPGVGWCIQAIAEDLEFFIDRSGLTQRVAESRKRARR